MYSNRKEGGSEKMSLGVMIQAGLFVAAWAALLVLGFGQLIKYESTASQKPAAPREAAQFRDPAKMSVVLALHPHCPCSRATAGELLKVYSHAPDKFSLTILVYKPKDEPDSWASSRTLDSLSRLNPKIVIDADGVEAMKLGLATSGQVLLYDRDGKLLFDGGVTKSRGHSGDNLGEDTLIALLNESPASPSKISSTPVFGCSLSNKTP